MLTKTNMALAIVLVFGSASAVLADSGRGTTHHGRAVRGAKSPTLLQERNGAAKHAVKPFTAEEKGWFDRASRVF
jgi:hypothetical protein